MTQVSAYVNLSLQIACKFTKKWLQNGKLGTCINFLPCSVYHFEMLVPLSHSLYAVG